LIRRCPMDAVIETRANSIRSHNRAFVVTFSGVAFESRVQSNIGIGEPPKSVIHDRLRGVHPWTPGLADTDVGLHTLMCHPPETTNGVNAPAL
jgi:hypothetical protein